MRVKGQNEVPTDLDQLQRSLSGIDPERMSRGAKKIFERGKRIRPGFAASWVHPRPPEGVELVRKYKVGDADVRLYCMPEGTVSLYHVSPFEHSLERDQIELLELAREALLLNRPTTVSLDRPEQARSHVFRHGVRHIMETARSRGLSMTPNGDGSGGVEEARRLAEILARYTAGLGIAEVFLRDANVQDVYVDAPASENRVYVTLGGLNEPRLFDSFVTNVVITDKDVAGMLSRFKYESGRPFSEARPVLETDLSGFATRVTAIGPPLSPHGTALALRRHSTEPWTLLRLIANGTMTAEAAGLLSFLIDGNSTFLIAGSRGAGKSSLLGALMLEFPRGQRILTIEDTPELPVRKMQGLGYKVQGLTVQSSPGGTGEMTADDALRVSLRLGESAIVLGEVRGREAKTLYEAMRAGTAGSAVLGTIHGNSARSVYERVVHDMGIPPRAFSATDVVVISGLTRPGGSMRKVRRVVQVTEVIKEGEPGEFRDLMVHDEKKDRLVWTEDAYGSERIGAIARSWGISTDDALKNIEARGRMRAAMTGFSTAKDEPKLLQAPWVGAANDAFWRILEARSGEGKDGRRPDYARVLSEWDDWFGETVRYV